MNFLKFLLKSLSDIIKKLPVQWLLSIKSFLKWLNKLLKGWCSEKKPHSARDTIDEKCGPIDHPSFHRADPLIYSQKYLKSLGLAVTWNNPDIILKKDGIVVTENDLLPDTDYVIESTIWNNSYEAPAVGVGVDVSFLSFGAGTTKHNIGHKSINLGVKGGANHPARVKVIWRTPITPGHYCLQVDIDWFDDVNPANNMGQNNVRIEEPQSPAQFQFKLKNDTPETQRYRLEPDSYELPTQKDCETIIKRESNKNKWKRILDAHNADNFPVPQDWNVEIIPRTLSLQSNEETTIEVHINPPSSFIGKMAFNVNAFYGKNKFAGGVTLYVSKSL